MRPYEQLDLKQSDEAEIEIANAFRRSKGIINLIPLQYHLEENLTAFPGLKVDLVTRPALKGNIGERILREAVSA